LFNLLLERLCIGINSRNCFCIVVNREYEIWSNTLDHLNRLMAIRGVGSPNWGDNNISVDILMFVKEVGVARCIDCDTVDQENKPDNLAFSVVWFSILLDVFSI
jgi:hypothetical protein